MLNVDILDVQDEDLQMLLQKKKAVIQGRLCLLLGGL